MEQSSRSISDGLFLQGTLYHRGGLKNQSNIADTKKEKRRQGRKERRKKWWERGREGKGERNIKGKGLKEVGSSQCQRACENQHG
jgi:hypothetical protein